MNALRLHEHDPGSNRTKLETVAGQWEGGQDIRRRFAALRFAAIAIALLSSVDVFAQPMTMHEHDSSRDAIDAVHEAAGAACEDQNNRARIVCRVDVESAERMARADLEATYRPSATTRYRARITRAAGTYALARERCNDSAVPERPLCIRAATSQKDADRRDARRRFDAEQKPVRPRDPPGGAG